MNATNGDFIERHAKAVSGFAKTIVLFVDKDNSLRAGDLQVEKTVDGNLIVYKAYYGASKIGGWWGKLQSLRQYRAAQRTLYAQIVREQGTPNLVHVHVAMKAGLLALHLKKTYGLPYIVTEHWTGYDPASNDSLHKKGIAWKYLNKKILQDASLSTIMPLLSLITSPTPPTRLLTTGSPLHRASSITQGRFSNLLNKINADDCCISRATAS